jgi:hypothetical protein
MFARRSLCPPALLLVASFATAADKPLVEPGRGFNVADAQTTDAKLSVTGTTLRIETGHTQPWPGVKIWAPGGRWDLSPFDRVMLTVKNTGPVLVTVNCRVDNTGANGTDHCLTGRVDVPPGANRELSVRLTRRMPESLSKRLFGMRGFPGGYQEKGGIDAAQVVALLIFVAKPAADHQFEVSGIRAAGSSPGEPPPPERLFPLIDRYGQYIHKTWPGKITAEADFAERQRQEAADLAAHPAPAAWDQYGGWATGPKLEATGRFRVAKHQDKWWFVDPDGRLFWSHGNDCVRTATGVTPITDRESWFADLPGRDSPFGQFYGRGNWAPHGYYQGKSYATFDFTGANLLRKYGNDWKTRSAELAHQRLRSWGMNTIGNWSDPKIYSLRKTPYVSTVHASAKPIEGSAGYWGKFDDPFHPDFGKAVAKAVEAENERVPHDPWRLGYFIGNELSWGDETSLSVGVLSSPPTQPAKAAFLAHLRTKYDTIDKLNAAWKTKHASWDALLQSTTPPKIADARDDLQAFYSRMAEKYFEQCQAAVKAADPQGLYLGCRFAWVNDRAVRASAKFCDVISYNKYSDSVADFRYPDGVDLPMIIGEFHFGALDRGMFHTGLRPVADQQARGDAYRAYVRGALENRWIVGTHWFQYGDQATTGRGDGENYQIGFVDVCDTPYPETIAACRDIGYQMYRVR